MRTRDKVRLVRRFKDGESTYDLAWMMPGDLSIANLNVQQVIREAMNGAPWWPPTKKGGKK